MALALGTVSSVAHVCTAAGKEEQDDLGEEPSPAAALLGNVTLDVSALVVRSRSVGRAAGAVVQVLGGNRDDVVVVAEFAGFRAESKVGDVGDLGRVVDLEAGCPLIFFLVLEVEFELLVLDIGETHLGGNAGVSNATSRATCQLRLLTIVVLVVGSVSVAKHGHDVGEDNTRAVVLVRVDKDSEAFESISRAKDRAHLTTLLGDPHGEAIAVELVLS